jgi:hypothetical protein
LKDAYNGVDGKTLIEQGKGVELYQQRILGALSRGLGSDLVSKVTGFTHLTQASEESVSSYVDWAEQVLSQITHTDGCQLESIIQKIHILNGLMTGAYGDTLKPFITRVFLGHGKDSVFTSTLSELTGRCSDILASSPYTHGNILLAGKRHPAARDAQQDAPHRTTPLGATLTSRKSFIGSAMVNR